MAVRSAVRPVILYVINEAYFLLSHRSEILRAATARYATFVAAPEDHVWAPEGFTIAEVEHLGARYVPIRMSRRGQNPFDEFGTLRSILRVFRQTKPDVVHLLTIKANLYGGLIARLIGIPAVVFSVTGLGQVFVARGMLAALRRAVVTRTLRFAFSHPRARVIVQNAEDLRYLVEKQIVTPDKAVLIRGAGVDADAFRPTPEPEGAVTIVLASRLLWEKGVGTFVEAAKILGGCSTRVRFVVVGDTKASNPRSVPKETLEQWVNAGLIEWWGRRTDMPAVLAQAHVFCLPTAYGEGIPKVLLEAGASARPIVASDIAGCREVVQPGVNGLLVPPNDPAQLAQALEFMISHGHERRQMGQAGRAIAEREFNVDTVVKTTLALYDELLGASSQ